jgi:hypothetical protein
VLTPQRALKFTALTIERHYVWLTALSFLSHSSGWSRGLGFGGGRREVGLGILLAGLEVELIVLGGPWTVPKGAGSSTPFNRSILVLTPQRALKFTALTIEPVTADTMLASTSTNSR